MEVSINILDTFPSFNKLSQKNNLLLEYNNKEYNLNNIINQQDIFSIKENASQISFKIYVLSNNNKVLIGTNQINIDSLNSDNKSSIIWLEFKKKIEENKKEINDLNLLFYDCIRLKIKVSKIKTIPKTDKKLKTNKSKIKFGSPNQQMKKIKKKYNIKENNNLVNSCRIGNTNNYLLKSNSLKDNIRTIVDNNVKNEDNDKKDTSKDNDSKHIMEKYQELKIDPKKSISYEYMKELKIENDALLTDYNIFDNYDSITLHGDNSKNITYTKNRSNVNCDAILQNSLSPSNFNNMIKNILLQSNEEDINTHPKRDSSFNKDINTIKEDESFNNSNANTNSNTNTNRIKKLKAYHKKTKSLNKIFYNCNNNDSKKRDNINSKEISNLKNKNKKNENINKSLSKENLLHGYYTLNDFYNKKLKNNPINEKDNNININAIEDKEIVLKERKMTSDEKNTCLNGVLTPKIKETGHQNDIEEFEVTKDDINEEGPINFEQFYSMKKDYELFYTLKFIENIKNDLLDLEFNLALDKSISLFMLYNKEVNSFYKRKKELVNVILNYEHKIEEIHKQMDLLSHKKRKNERKEKNRLLIHDVALNLNKKILSQKNILENLVTNKINKKELLKSIFAILIKKQPLLLEIINKNKNKNIKDEEKEKVNEKEKEKEKGKEKEIKNKLPSQSPIKSFTKSQFKLQRVNDGFSKKKEPNLSENKIRSKSKNTLKKSQVEINVNKLKNNNKKKILKKNKSVKKNLIVTSNEIKNLIKNSSINNLLSLDKISNRNSLCTENLYNKESKSGDINNIHSVNNEIVNGKNNNSNSIYYSTVRNKFYSFNPGKLNK